MKKVCLLILFLLLSSTKSSLDDCKAITDISCATLETEYDLPESLDINAFQTPPRNDALGNYISTYQDMRYLVGWAEYNYNAAKTRCTITFNTKVNPDMGVEDEDYKIYYTFGNFEEQESNEITLNSRDDSYPNGLSCSCRIINIKTGNEAVSLQLQDVYLLWDNIEVDTPPEYEDGQRGSIVELFGWSMEDVAEECEFLGIAGYLGVKIFSPTESLLSEDLSEANVLNPWWYGTQIASYKYEARSGNQKQLRKTINRCRSNNVRVYAEIVVNHMTGEGNDVNYLHYTGSPPCTTWGPKPGSGLSPFFTYSYQVQNNYYTGRPPVTEYPAVPFFPSDFHCTGSFEGDDGYTYGYLFGLQDLNTEKEYPRKRIATLIVDLISIGISGVSIGNGKHIPNYSWAKILSQVKYYLGNKLPLDFMVIIILENLDPGTLFCNEEGTLDFGTTFYQQLKGEGFRESEILQIKIWSKGILTEDPTKYIGDYDIACGEEEESQLKFDIKRWTVSLEYSDDINMGDTGYNIYIKDKDVKEHKRILINNMFLHPKFNFPIRFVFSSFSIGAINGIPDGKSEKSYCATTACLQNVEDLPFKRAFNPHSRGYDCGDGEKDWKIGEYSRVHRDIDVINAMREWIYSTPEKNITSEELYSKDEAKAVCDEKCLICNEESKILDKCIFCNSDDNYYPVMEIGGSEEYYECYKRDAKVERLYFSNRDKAFLPCYETCRYCNELGDINNHKCLACDYNLIKKPGTKETAVTFNCVTSCTYSYYYTESGQYKCTNNPICPSDKNIYIENKRKCVSSCKEEAPFIYLFNGNCVEECPDEYIPDQKNNICRLKDSDQCTLGSKIEIFSSIYSLSMLNSFAKEYRDEYTYTDKYVSIIKNENYKIIIFKDFDCINLFDLGIPDLRNNTNGFLQENEEESIETQLIKEDSCYEKVQNNLDIEENLIVVYIEDNNNLIPEKGYLLYNPITGGKINYESICNYNELTKKEDKTVDEDSNDNLLAYIYLSKNKRNICKEGEAPFEYNEEIICLNILERQLGLYYHNQTNKFYKCHDNCKYCNTSGSNEENNCTECAEGYIKHPKDNKTDSFSCVIKCVYSYFFDSFGRYTCNPASSCPDDKKFYIEDKKQCIDSCKNDDKYKLTYNGNCLKDCPKGLVINENNGYCIKEKNSTNSTSERCTWSKKEAKIKNYDDEHGLNNLVKEYYEEFYSIKTHVSEYNSTNNYNLTIYVDSTCLTELNLSFPNVDFGSCYQKVQNATGINSSLIVALVKVLNKTTGRTSSLFSLYSPLDGSKLDAVNICRDVEIVVESNVFNILEESGVDYKNMEFMTGQNINIFDRKDAFYTDICFEFESPNDRDITLGDRIKIYYPNVTLCEEGCSSKGVNLTSMKAICSCPFSDISGDKGKGSGLVSDYVNILSSSNYMVLTCIKYCFKNFGSSFGGFLMIICILIVVLMGLSFHYKDSKEIKKYIIDKTSAYLNYLNEAFKEEDKKTDIKIKSNESKINDSKYSKSSKSESNSKIKYESKSKAPNKQASEVDVSKNQKESSERNGNILMINKINSSKEPFNSRIINNKLAYLNKSQKVEPVKEDFNKYLAPDIDDLDFEEIIIQEKRTFKEYFWDSLKNKQIFIKTFYAQDIFRPKSIKIIAFILDLILYCIINAFFIGDDTISEIYHIEGKDPYFGFFNRALSRYVYAFLIRGFINIILEIVFVEEKNMKKIFIREKRNVGNLKIRITKLSKAIIMQSYIFMIAVIAFFVIMMIYLLCFNYVYPHTQSEWVKSSILLIIIMQIISILYSLLETSLRYIAFALKEEKFYNWSKILS